MSVFGGRNVRMVSTWGSRVSALRSSEASAPQRLKCNGVTQLSALGAVSSLGRVRFGRFHCNCFKDSR